MATRKTKPTDPDTPSEPKGPRRISIELNSRTTTDCAEVAKATGLQESKVRELVRAVATDAANSAAQDVKAIIKAHLTEALG